jgi:hypothetical protein
MSANTAPPSVALLQLVTSFWIARAISVAARLGIADLLTDGPSTCDELARGTGAHAPTLYRLLRALASVGVFVERDDGRFGLTPMAESLRTDAPSSIRAYAVMLGEDWFWRAWGDLDYSVTTGESGFEHVFGMPLFEYCRREPQAGLIFDAALTDRSRQVDEAVLAAYDFSGIHRLIDVGGGQGALLTSILRANPAMHGVLFDLPQVVAGARDRFGASVPDRLVIVGGDFFESVPAGGNAYLLKHVLHDWDDERATAILRSCHTAMAADARLLLVEIVIPPGNDASFGKLLDLLMLVMFRGGRERTRAEYEALLTRAGFALTKVIPTASLANVLEATRR